MASASFLTVALRIWYDQVAWCSFSPIIKKFTKHYATIPKLKELLCSI